MLFRSAQQLTVLRLAGGGTAWRRSLPRPVVAIEPVRDLVLVAADRLSAFVAATGALAWQVPLRGARLAATGRDVVAVTDLRIVGLDAAGGTRWQVPLPDAVGDALPDQLTTDGPVAIVTFRPRPARAQPPDADVVAVALDAPG